MNNELKLIEQNMEKAIESLKYNLTKIRTGRANPAMLDSVKVEAYGSLTPLNQVALVNVAEARQLTVKAFDPSLTSEVEKAIMGAGLGLNPTSDGELIRISIPALTEESRKLLVKEAKGYLEEAKVIVRNVRHDAMNSVKKSEDLTEDEKKKMESQIEDITKKYNASLEEIEKKKEQDIMTI